MQTVKVKKEFLDRMADMKQRKIGEEYETKKERAKYLSILGFVDIIADKTKLKTKETD